MSEESRRREELISVCDFYAHRDVFITGATGFLGKCLLEKILRDIPDVGRVMILIRPKRDKTAEERVKGILDSKCFDTIRESKPELLDKVVPIIGNLGKPQLGIGEEDRKLLINNISIIIHLAATVKFDAPLRESLTLNVVAVKELIKLSREMKKLVSIVHTSTAYAHCNRTDTIDEIIYPPKVHPDKVIDLLDWMTDEQLEAISPTMLEGRPNTYTYTKSLAEYVLANEAKGLPLSIVRPSIVGGSFKEPYPGWVDCLHGPTGLFVAIGKGLLRVLRTEENGQADMVPVDLINNAIISIGWLTGLKPPTQPIIYQYTCGASNPIKWIELYNLVVESYTSNPFDEVFRRPYVIKCRPQNAWKFWHFILHLVPGFCADMLLRIQGKKPRMLKLYGKIEAAVLQLDYFLLHDWKWTYTNCAKLSSLLSEEDKKLFDFDLTKLDWRKYVRTFSMGTKTFLLNEDPANLPVARRQMKRLRNMRYTFNFLIFLVATRLVYIKSRIARELWSSMLGFCIQMVVKLAGLVLHG